MAVLQIHESKQWVKFNPNLEQIELSITASGFFRKPEIKIFDNFRINLKNMSCQKYFVCLPMS